MRKNTYFKNSLTSLALLLANIMFSIFFVSAYVKIFGLEQFSGLSIFLQVSAALLLINSPLNTALTRLSIADDANSLNYFQAVFFCTVVMFSLVLVVAIFIYPQNSDYLSFSLVILGTLFFCLSLNENIYLFKTGCLYVQNILQIFNILLRVVVFFILVEYLDPLLSFSISFFVVNVVHYLIMKLYFCKKNIQSRNYYDINLIFSYAAIVIDNTKYLAINSLGAVLLRNIDLFLIVYFLGKKESGTYALYLQVIILIRLFTEALSTSIAPKILKGFILNEADRSFHFILFLKFINFFVGVFTIILLLNFDRIWLLWIGDVVQYDISIISVLIVSSALTGGFYAFTYVQNALNKNKVPALLSLVFGLVYLLLGIGVFYFELGIIYYALSYALVITSKNFIFSSYYNSLICKTNFFSNLKTSFSSIIPAVLPGTFLLLLNYIFNYSLIEYFTSQFFVILFSFLFFYRSSINVEERRYIINILRVNK